MLLNHFLPNYHFSEYHACVVRAPAECIYRQVKRVNMGRSWIIKGLLTARMLPHRLQTGNRANARRAITFEDFVSLGFIPLADCPPDEMVLGLVGQFWKPAARLRTTSPATFKDFADPGYCKAGWNIQVRPLGRQTSELCTTTRIYCLGTRARLRFTLYWGLVRPFSGLIRRNLLQLIRREAEKAGACI